MDAAMFDLENVPRFGISRRSQHKRSLHSREVRGAAGALAAPLAAQASAPHAKRPRLKVVARRAATAPSNKDTARDSSDSDTAATTTGSGALGKAASCPPLKEGLALALDDPAPLTPRILALQPTAAIAAASKSPPPASREPSPQELTGASPVPGHPATSMDTASAPHSQASGCTPAATADTAATAASALARSHAPQLPAISSPGLSFPSLPLVASPPVLAAARAGAPDGACTSAALAKQLLSTSPPSGRAGRCAKSPATPTLATPPPETPRSAATLAAARSRASKGPAAVRGRVAAGEPRAGGYQGRFCGRLYLKEDEGKLAEECQLLGPLLGSAAEGCAREGEPGRHTLAKIVRGFASGAVRAHCQQRERRILELEVALEAQEAASRATVEALTAENRALRAAANARPAAAPVVPSSNVEVAAAGSAAQRAAAALKAAPLAPLPHVQPMSPALRRVMHCKPPAPRFSAGPSVHALPTAFAPPALPQQRSALATSATPLRHAAEPPLPVSEPSLAASSLAALSVSCLSGGASTSAARSFGLPSAPIAILGASRSAVDAYGLACRSVDSVAGSSITAFLATGSAPGASPASAPCFSPLAPTPASPQLGLQQHLAAQRAAYAALSAQKLVGALQRAQAPPQQQQQQLASGGLSPQGSATPFAVDASHRSAFRPVAPRGAAAAGVLRPQPTFGVPPVALAQRTS